MIYRFIVKIGRVTGLERERERYALYNLLSVEGAPSLGKS